MRRLQFSLRTLLWLMAVKIREHRRLACSEYLDGGDLRNRGGDLCANAGGGVNTEAVANLRIVIPIIAC